MVTGNEKKINIEITTRTILKMIGIIAITAFIIYFKEILLIMITSFIIMAGFRPIYIFLTSRKVSRTVAAALIVLLVIFVVGGLFAIVTVPLANQLKPFIEQFPQMVLKLVDTLRSKLPFLQSYLSKEAANSFLSKLGGEIGSQLGNFGSTLWETLLSTLGVFGVLLTVITTFVLSVYMLVERDLILKRITGLFSIEEGRKIKEIIEKVEFKIGAWLRGQLFLCLVIGVITWLSLLVMGVKYAGALGITAGILEVLPIIGPILASFPIVIAGFSMGVWYGVGAIIVVFIIQQLENSILVPLVMKRAVGLNPVVTLIAVIVGKEMFGWFGALIAVPATAIVTVIVNEYLVSRGIIVEKEATKG